jgi:SAM-dependent methyltransferase
MPLRAPGVRAYFSALATEAPERNLGNLRFYLDYLFDGVPLRGRSVLDVGAGDGVYSFYAAASGAKRVVALEPEAAGSSAGVVDRFERMEQRLGLDSVQLLPQSFQEFDPSGERFDVLLLHASVNHLDEEACIVLHEDASARETYRGVFSKLADMSAEGAHLIVADASRHNLFARLPFKSPVQPYIVWEKHQPPELWAGLLAEAGFTQSRIRWSSFNTLRRPGRLLLGNRLGAWLTLGVFCLTMRRG